jgi:superfamily II helicase
MKICSRCKQSKPLDSFYNDPRYKDGKTCFCKECMNKSAKKSNRKSLGKSDYRKALIKQGEENIKKIIERYGH